MRCHATVDFLLFLHAGRKAWNSLPHALQEIDSNIFKRKLKSFCLNTRSLHCDSVLPLVTLGVSVGQLELNHHVNVV